MEKETIDEEEIIDYLKNLQGNKTATEFAKQLNCSCAYISDVYHGKREVGPKLLKSLNITKTKTITYEVPKKKWRAED